MSRESSFNLSVPLDDITEVNRLLEEAQATYVPMRVSRKPDRDGEARFYLSFPYAESRRDLAFHQWFLQHLKEEWDLFGPTHGCWGLK